MYSGPFRIPQALASRPFMVIFWATLAPTLFTYGLVALASVIAPDWTQSAFGDVGLSPNAWRMLTLSALVLFVLLSLWSERVGAGAFGGPMRSSSDWLALSVITGPIILYLSNALSAVLFAESYPHWPYASAELSNNMAGMALTPIVLIYALVLAPLIEEVSFRGLGMGCLLARGWPPVASVVITAVLFTGLHQQYVLPALIPIFIFGLYLGVLRLLSGSVVAPLLAHIATNTVFTLLYALSRVN